MTTYFAKIVMEIVVYLNKNFKIGETHKRIIIGKNGSMLKKISTFARQDIERFFDCRVFLQTWVKVKEDWRNRAQILQNFGYDEKNFD